MGDFNLERFVSAQDRTSGRVGQRVIDVALGELRSGKKLSHWMWFVFPQVRGLGSSEEARTYGIASLDEARAYLAHTVLGPRLVECASSMLDIDQRSAVEVLGSTDARKLRSSMTLFAIADPDQPQFPAVLDRYYDGVTDHRTLEILGLA